MSRELILSGLREVFTITVKPLYNGIARDQQFFHYKEFSVLEVKKNKMFQERMYVYVCVIKIIF